MLPISCVSVVSWWRSPSSAPRAAWLPFPRPRQRFHQSVPERLHARVALELVDRPITALLHQTAGSPPPEPMGPGQIRVVIDGVCQGCRAFGSTEMQVSREIVTFNPDGIR